VSVKVARWCAMGGPMMIGLYLIGFICIARFIPPPSPALTGEQLVAMYTERALPIRIGLWIACLAAAFLGPYFAVISTQMRRIEGPHSAPLASTQVTLGVLAIFEFILPQMLWQTAAYRAGRSPDSVQTLTDAGWLCYIGITSTFLVQLSAIGVAILLDRRERPLFPRWVGYYSIMTGMMIMPGSLCVFFHEGPFIWSGLFGWWIPLIAFSGWFPVMTWALWTAIGAPDERGTALSADPDVRAELDELRAELAALRTQPLAG